MCGIAGKLSGSGQEEKGTVIAMVDAMRHRGPDHQAVEVVDGAVLGHARLSIIDLDARSNQPLADPSGRFWICYNGEVYNFQALRHELEQKGHRFRTQSDTEVVLHAFMQWDVGCLERFNGMFALAFYDSHERRLILARDRFGQKPLFYSSMGTFASELSAMLKDPAIQADATLSIAGLNQYFALGYTLAPYTVYNNIKRLEPGSYLVFKDGAPEQPRRYFDYAKAFSAQSVGCPKVMAKHIEHLLDQAVKRRLLSDVPLGSFLSGGLDSSSVVALARRHVSYDLHTFSVGFAAASYDESSDARVVSEHLKTIHHERRIQQDEGKALVQTAIGCFDAPFSDTSLVPMVEVSRVASEHVKVVLSGDGADELLAGYVTYQADRLKRGSDLLPVSLRRFGAKLIQAAAPASNRKTGLAFKASQFAKGLAQDAHYGHYAWRELHTEEERIELIGRDFAAAIRASHPAEIFRQHYRDVAHLDWLSQHLYVDAKTWLEGDVLVKVDRASMAASIEARAPFLDIDLVRAIAALPNEQKLQGRQGKPILKRATADLLPERTRRKKKAGFNAPINVWLSNHGENEFRFFNRYVWENRAERRLAKAAR